MQTKKSRAPEAPACRRHVFRGAVRACATSLLLLVQLLDAAGSERARYATDRVIVKFRQGAEQRRSAEGDASLLQALGLSDGDARLLDPGAGSSTHHVLKLLGDLSVEELVRRLQGHPLLEYAELDHIGCGAESEPNDQGYAYQWHHPRVDSPEAWAITKGAADVIVAVLDTGVNVSLVEFSGRTVPGYDFVNNDADPADDNGHGTAVAGAICANANNRVLVAGMDWECRLMPVKVLDHANEGFYSDWAYGVNWAVAHGAKIINLSAGGDAADSTLAAAISNAVSQGVVFVTATHNGGVGTISFPARLANTIAVGSTGTNDSLYATSNYGPEMDLVAPGEAIVTVSSTGTLIAGTGTSFAAAVVSGVAALICAERPELENEAVRKILRAAAEDGVGDTRDTPGFDIFYGWGRLNAYNALLLASLRCSAVEAQPGGGLTIVWPSPDNASTKDPFGIEFAGSPTGIWSRLATPSNIVYTATESQWTDDGSETGSPPATDAHRFYRPFLK